MLGDEMLRTRLFERYVEGGPRMSLSELAGLLDMSERHLRRIRDGAYPITTSFVSRACHRLGVPEEWLFYREAGGVALGKVGEVADMRRAPPA